MKKLFLWGMGLPAAGFALLLVIAAIAGPHLPPAAAAAPSSAARVVTTQPVKQFAFSDRVLMQLGRESPKWSDIRFNPDNSKNNFSLTIVYRRTPSGYAEVQADTERLARAVLATLLADGRNPHTEWISVFVHAQQPAGQGETGVELTRSYGSTSYDFNSDQLVFEGPK